VHELSIGVCSLSRDALGFVSKIGIGRVQRFVLHQLVFELEVYIGVNSSLIKYQGCGFGMPAFSYSSLQYQLNLLLQSPGYSVVTSSSQKPLTVNDSIQWRFSRHSPGNIVNPHQWRFPKSASLRSQCGAHVAIMTLQPGLLQQRGLIFASGFTRRPCCICLLYKTVIV
jgi:hypothetical protein